MRITTDRRAVVTGLTAAATAFAAQIAFPKNADARAAAKLKPGTYQWTPERSPEGPVSIVVSLPDQVVHVYRNGVRIGLSSCSTGKPGHRTPTGVFTILQKDKHHHSSTYNNAPMPNMHRLTWSGVALHAGHLPGYPASHGCIRLPLKFSELLFSVTHVGTAVIVADEHSEPIEVVHPGTILADHAKQEMGAALAKVAKKKLPPKKRHAEMQHAVSLLVSGADRMLYIVKDGKTIAQGKIDIERPQEPLGSHVFTLLGANGADNSLKWTSVGFKHSQTGVKLGQSDVSVIERIESNPDLSQKVHEQMHPGLLLVMTDAKAHPDTRSKNGFVVVTQDTGWTTDVSTPD
jgi:hypothetical protein